MLQLNKFCFSNLQRCLEVASNFFFLNLVLFRVELVIRGALRRFELFKRCIFRTFFNFESDNKRLLWVVFAYELIKPRNFFLASGSTILKVGEPQFKIFMTAKKSNLMKLTPNFKSALTQNLRVIFNLKNLLA